MEGLFRRERLRRVGGLLIRAWEARNNEEEKYGKSRLHLESCQASTGSIDAGGQVLPQMLKMKGKGRHEMQVAGDCLD